MNDIGIPASALSHRFRIFRVFASLHFKKSRMQAQIEASQNSLAHLRSDQHLHLSPVYFVDTLGRGVENIRRCIREHEAEEQRFDQLELSYQRQQQNHPEIELTINNN